MDKSETVVALVRSYADKPWRSSGTFDLIEGALRERFPVETAETADAGELRGLLDRLRRERNGRLFVFNIAEYLDERRKSGFLPALLDEWGCAHLGSSASAAATALDKAAAKTALLGNGIPTPAFFVARDAAEAALSKGVAVGFPLFVKPLGEGGHLGIDADSIVRNRDELGRAIRRVVDSTGGGALVERYVDEKGMREFSVGVLDGAERLFTPIEIDYAAMGLKTAILDYRAAQDDLERVSLVSDAAARGEAVRLAARTFDAVGASDYARVDIRMNDSGWYVLEINAMPGLGPRSFLPEAAEAQHGLDYPRLIRKLAEDSMRRQGLL